jgi:hypothetical protein
MLTVYENEVLKRKLGTVESENIQNAREPSKMREYVCSILRVTQRVQNGRGVQSSWDRQERHTG